jgi:hypothetical protein
MNLLEREHPDVFERIARSPVGGCSGDVEHNCISYPIWHFIPPAWAAIPWRGATGAWYTGPGDRSREQLRWRNEESRE